MSTTPLNLLTEKIRAAHPHVYDDMDDATLTKKVLAKYPQYSDLAAPKISRPAPPERIAPSSFSERIGERIEQNVYAIPNAIEGHTASYQEGLTTPKAKAEAEQEVHQQAEGTRHLLTGGATTLPGKIAAYATVAPRMVYEQAKQYIQHPETAIGDLVLLFPELSEMRMPGNKTYKPGVGTEPVTAPDPAYTAALDKANDQFSSDAKAYHDKLTKAFDDAKREHAEALAKYDQETKAHADKHQQAAKEYHEKLTGVFDEAKRKQLADAAQYEQDRAKWIKDWQDYRKAETEARDAAQRTKTLAQGTKDAVKSTFDNLKQTYKTGRAALNERWGQWNKSVEGITRDPKHIYDTIEEAKTKRLRGSPGSLQEFNNLLGELGVQEFEDTPEGRKAIIGQEPVPIETLRTHYSAIVRRIMKGGLPGNIYQALQDVRAVVDKQILEGAKTRSTAATDLVGNYEALKGDEYRFDSDWEDRKSPLANALNQLDPNFLEPKLLGRGNEYITKQLGRYTQYGADPTLPQKASQLAGEAKTAAKVKVKVPKEPGPEPTPPSDMVEGKPPAKPAEAAPPAHPELPEKPVPAAPELKPVERPGAGAQKLGMMSRAAARIVGKLGGAAAGTLVGHPMVGWAAGGELAPEILNRIITARGAKAVPVTVADMATLSPVEKAGIQNGITKRLIEAAEKGEPLPPLSKFQSVLTREQMQQAMQAVMKGKSGVTGSVQ